MWPARRNVACISCGVNFWVGFIIVTHVPYRQGIAPTVATVGARTETVVYASPYGLIMGLFCVAAALVAAAFER